MPRGKATARASLRVGCADLECMATAPPTRLSSIGRVSESVFLNVIPICLAVANPTLRLPVRPPTIGGKCRRHYPQLWDCGIPRQRVLDFRYRSVIIQTVHDANDLHSQFDERSVSIMNLPILVIDNDSQVRSLIGTVLKKQGFRILEAGDGVAALSAVRETDGAIGLIVTDHFMPGLVGAALARDVREQYPTIPILLISSEPTQCDGHCGDAFLPKPFVPSVLVETVRRLHKPQP